MTEHEIELAHALNCCTYPPGSPPKRFARNMAFIAQTQSDRELTDRQRYYMEIMAWRFRRQMPADLVPAAKPIDLPPKRKTKKVKAVAEVQTASEQLDLL